MRASFNPQPLKRKLANRARGFNAALPDVMRRAGRVVSVSLATSTVPYGLGDNARIAAELAVKRDIRKCYATPGDVFAAFPDRRKAYSFWRAIVDGKFAQAQKIMQAHCPKFHHKEIRPFDGGQAHRANRNSRGRVSKNQEPVFVVQTTRDLKAYIQYEVDQVGTGKAGWAADAKALGSMRGIPQWVTRHVSSKAKGNARVLGTVIEDYRGPVKMITLRNEVDYAQDILSETEKQIAIRIGLDRLQQALFTEEARIAQANAF